MILLENETKHTINIKLLEEINNYLNVSKDIELIITHNDKISKLNKEFRNKNYPTDVLSFPLEDIPFMPLGTIVISLDKAKEVAQELQHSLDEELTLLYIHGLLHLLGYDHEIDNGEMREKEKELIKHFNLPKSLIIRGEE
jgi:probable rRNA maturation factor